MKAILLAAGVGRRLSALSEDLPKTLLRFGGKSLLERHLLILQKSGVSDVTIVVGHRADAIRDEVVRLNLPVSVRYCENPRYREGSIVSLWAARDVLHSGGPILVMDADVLYGPSMMAALLKSRTENCFLLDRDVEAGDEPQKLCIREGKIVDLHKRPTASYDWYGESIGFLRCAETMAQALARQCDLYVREGRTDVEHEEAIRDLIKEYPAGSFGFVDVTGSPWLEIDFPEDVARGEMEILPKLGPLSVSSS